jgi:hypothetical protein
MRSRKDTAFPWSPPGSTGTPCTSRSEKTNSSAPEVRPVRPHCPVRHSNRQPSRTSLLLSQRQCRLYINGIQVTERVAQGTKLIFWPLRVSNWSASLVCCCQVLLVPEPQCSVNVMANEMITRHWHHTEMISKLYALRVLILVLTGKMTSGPQSRYELGWKD